MTATLLLLLLSGAATTTADSVDLELVAPGVVSTQDGEYSPTFDVARQELIFMRRTPGRFDYTLYSTRLGDDGWSAPVVLPFSGRDRDAGPALSPDGNTLVFDSRRPHPELGGRDIDLWRVERSGDDWGEPELILAASANPDDEPDAQRDEFGPVLTREGELLWYSFRRPERGGAFYRLDLDGEVRRDRSLPDPSAPTFVAYLALSADGTLAVIEGRSRSGRGTDLFYSCRGEDGWSRAEPIDSINSDFGEGGPALTSDGASLFFVSDRPTRAPGAGDANLYRVSLHALGLPCGP